MLRFVYGTKERIFVNTSIVIKVITLAIAGVLLLLLRGYIHKYCSKAFSIILISAFTLSLLLSQLFSFVFYPAYTEDSVEIEGQILEINEYTASYGVVIKTATIDEKADTHKLLLYVNKFGLTNIEIYDNVKLFGRIQEITASDKFDADIYYNSRGISATVEDVTEFLVVNKGKLPIEFYLDEIKEVCADRITDVTSTGTAAFLRALVLGDRTELDGNTKLNFKRIGISHILALSGMHLSILCFGLMKLLSLMKVNKKIKLTLLGVLCVFYMALTGFSTTICRAAIMNLITYALFLLRYKSDVFTSLLIAVSCIIIIEPFAIFDWSLQLSFLAMLGIIACADLLTPYRPKTVGKRVIFAAFEVVAVSAFANIAILPISVARFEMVSVLGPISTLFFSIVCTLLIYIGILIIFFGNFLFLGNMANFITDCLKHAAEFFSNSKWVYSSTNFELVKIVAFLTTIIFFAYLLLKIKNKRVCTGIFTALYIVTILLSTVFNAVQINADSLEFNPVSSDSILIKTEGNSALIYSGGNSKDSAYETIDFLSQDYLSYLDCLILQNYNTKLVEYVETLISNVKVERILISEPQNETELKIAEDLALLLQYFGASIRFYAKGDSVNLGTYTYSLFDHTPYETGKSCETVYTLTSGVGEVYTYVTEGTKLENYSVVMRHTDCLIIGNYGKVYSSSYLMQIKCDSIDRIVIGCDLRLDETTKEYYKEKGAIVSYTTAPYSLLD